MKSRHTAPPVQYPVGRSFRVGAFVLWAQVVAAWVMLLWWMQSPAPGVRHGAGLGLVAIAGACAWWHWWRSPVGVLHWDGQQWHWMCGPVSALLESPVVSLDLQRYMLLRVRMVGASGRSMVWLHLEKAAFPQRWLDVRRAVYSPAGAKSPHVRDTRPGSVHPPGP